MNLLTQRDRVASHVSIGKRWVAIGIPLLIASGMGGCAAPAPVVITEADQAARLVFTCPNAKTLEVTRAQAGQLAIVVVDGRTLQLPRVANVAAERYSNRLQTLNVFGNSASFESLGHATVGPCTASYSESSPPAPGRGRATPRDRD